MNKTQLQQEITKLEQELTNPHRTPEQKTKIKHWKGLLEQDLKNYD